MRITPLPELPRPQTWWKLPDYAYEERPEGLLIAPRTDDGGLDQQLFDLPIEVLPRLLEVDLADPGSILAFVRKFGPLQADLAAINQVRPLPVLAPLRRRTRPTIHDAIELGKQRVGSSLLGEYLLEFQYGAGVLHGLTACRQALEQAALSEDYLSERWSRYTPWPCPKGPLAAGLARLLLVQVLQAALPVTPLLVPVEDGKPVETLALLHKDLELIPTISPPRSLFGVCVLELFNHVVADRRFWTCASETCHRLFTLQEGRSRFGGHRPDLARYCSSSCGQAQAQREYRRRKAAASESPRPRRKR